jgi:hypothetical protein
MSGRSLATDRKVRIALLDLPEIGEYTKYLKKD